MYRRITFVALSVTLACWLPPARADVFEMDFDAPPTSLQFFGSAAWQRSDADGNGYLSITNADENQRGAIVFPDLRILFPELRDGEPLYDFTFEGDLRIGGGTDQPGEGFSINFVHPDDPVLDDGDGWSWSGPGQSNLPEEGATTGLAVGFDEASETAADLIGVGIRSNNAMIENFELSDLNGDADNFFSLQTGPAQVALDKLADAHEWAPIRIDYCSGFIGMSYKNQPYFEFWTVGFDPLLSRLVLGGRTGSVTANHHIDNVSIRRNEPRGCHGDGGPFSAGGINAIGVFELEGKVTNQEFSPNQPGTSGFRVKLVDTDIAVDNHTIAEEVLQTNDGETTMASYPFVDLGGGVGSFAHNQAYPNGVNDASMSDFAVEAIADLTIPAGTWSIGFGSDDGGKISIEGVTFEDTRNDDSLKENEIRFERNRGHGWTVGTFTLTEPLTTTITSSMHERGGGDSFEIAVLNDQVTEDASPDNGWELLADGVFGWEVTHFGNSLVSADIEARPLRSFFYYQFDVDGDTDLTDVLTVENPDDEIFTTILQIEDEDSAFWINGYGALNKGERFAIFDVDEIVGIPRIQSATYHQIWTFDDNTKEIVFGGAGDFNADNFADFRDVDSMLSQVVDGWNRPSFDLTGDRFVDSEDVRVLVTSPFFLNSYIGDANGDGEFNSTDLVQIFRAGEYEDGVTRNSTWATGDWNGDAEFDSGDLVMAFDDGGYEKGPRANAVPEPSTAWLLLTGALALIRRRN